MIDDTKPSAGQLAKVVAFCEARIPFLGAVCEDRTGSDRPTKTALKYQFHRNTDAVPFEELFDILLPENVDFKAWFPVIDDRIVTDDTLRPIGVSSVKFSWWNVDLVEVSVQYHYDLVQKLVIEARQARHVKNARGPTFMEIVECVEQFQIPVWFPVTKRKRGGPTESRYSGKPWLPLGTPWPLDEDEEPMAFVAQFNMEHLPHDMQEIAGSQGLISIFSSRARHSMTTNEDGINPSFKIFRFDLNQNGLVYKNPDKSDSREKVIVAWKETTEFPSSGDLCSGDLDIHQDIQAIINDLGDAFPQTEDRNMVHGVSFRWGKEHADLKTFKRAQKIRCSRENKLGGWPYWPEGADWPHHNGNRLLPLLQFNNSDGAALGWHEDLICHLFVDPEDPAILRITPWLQG